MDVVVLEVAGLSDLQARLSGVDSDTLVLAVPPGSSVDGDAARDAYAALDGAVVVAASSWPRVDEQTAAQHPQVSTPYRYIAGDALAGPTALLRALLAEYGGGDDAAFLTRCYLEGADVELDVAAALFVTLDGTGTDVIALDGRPYATATGRSPAVVIGDFSAIDALTSALRDDHSHDLARVLGYEPSRVAAAPLHAHAVAPEILAVPFWSREFCAALVRAAEAIDAWSSDPDDPVPGVEVSLATISAALFARVEEHVGDLVVPALRAQWPELAWTGLQDAFVIKYVPGPSGALRLHHDVAQISASVRLNEGYEGGALTFPRQGWDNASVPVGELIAWPSLVTHPHRAEPVTRGVKYGCTLWFALPT